jgi:mRNA-degrading endonuclease toxin of MazEF toxin-antitoxin module
MTPRRGEVWLFDLGMAGKVRPALIVSLAYSDLDRALLTIVPHTTSLRDSQYEIDLTVETRRVSGAEQWKGHPEARSAKERPVRLSIRRSTPLAWPLGDLSVSTIQ